MKVYLVLENEDHEGDSLQGVYDSVEAALASQKVAWVGPLNDPDELYTCKTGEVTHLYVTEQEVQGMPPNPCKNCGSTRPPVVGGGGYQDMRCPDCNYPLWAEEL